MSPNALKELLAALGRRAGSAHRHCRPAAAPGTDDTGYYSSFGNYFSRRPEP